MGITICTRPQHAPDSEYQLPSQGGPDSVRKSQLPTEHRFVSPVSMGHILGEGATIFTDMTETMLTTLDQQTALSDEAQKPKDSAIKISGHWVPFHLILVHCLWLPYHV